MSHTPGPWATYYDHPSCPTIAYIRPVGKPIHDEIATAYAVNDDVARADVRLLAAAPELLDAVRGLIRHIGTAAMYQDVPEFSAARAAIRKATGEA